MKKRIEKIRNKFQTRMVLTVKWALLTSLFIFIIFTIFAFVTYKTSMHIMVKQEKDNLNETLTKIVRRLEVSNQELTIDNSSFYLKDSPKQLQNKPKTESKEADLIHLNTFITELSQPELCVSVYNAKKDLVFETKKRNMVYTGKEDKVIKEDVMHGKRGFLASQAIQSKNSTILIGYVQLFYDLTSVYDIRKKLLITFFSLEVVGVLISLVLGYLLASYFLKPLKAITQTINSIKADPQTNVRVPEIETNDEIADLGKVFNDMMDRMQRFIVQQQQFVEDVSHELRTPVAIIEGHLKLLNRWGKDDPEVLEESLEASLQEIVRMKSLVQEMLDLSRVEQVEFQHKNDTSYAQEVTHQTFNNFSILYEDFDFILDDDLQQELTVSIYRNHFEQLLIILLDNAVKYSKDRKEIHMSVSSNINELEIAIQDFGEGISEEDIDRIFNRFYRVDKARSRNKGGNGLGLSIAQELVESYGGRILVESAVGQGTIFRVFLPIKNEENKNY